MKYIYSFCLILLASSLLAQITRTAKGTATDKTSGNTVTISSIAITQGRSLIVGTAFNGRAVSGVTWGGFDLTADLTTTNAAIYSLHNCPGTTSNIVLTYSGTGNSAKAAFALEVAGIAGKKDKTASAAGTSQTPSSGATATTSFGDEFVLGLVGTQGPSGDSAGTWQNSFTAGQRTGTTGNPAGGNSTVNEGFIVVTGALATRTASISNMQSRAGNALCVTYYSVTRRKFNSIN